MHATPTTILCPDQFLWLSFIYPGYLQWDKTGRTLLGLFFPNKETRIEKIAAATGNSQTFNAQEFCSHKNCDLEWQYVLEDGTILKHSIFDPLKINRLFPYGKKYM